MDTQTTEQAQVKMPDHGWLVITKTYDSCPDPSDLDQYWVAEEYVCFNTLDEANAQARSRWQTECASPFRNNTTVEVVHVDFWDLAELAEAAAGQRPAAKIWYGVWENAILDHAGCFNSYDEIAITWSVDDVFTVRPDLSLEDARRVLWAVNANHDANEGISWAVLEREADSMYPLQGLNALFPIINDIADGEPGAKGTISAAWGKAAVLNKLASKPDAHPKPPWER